MRAYELPLIEEGTAEEQLRQIKSFLYRQAETLNYNLRNSDVVSLWRQTAEALSVSSNDEVEEMRRDEFKTLRSLIIKSATSVIKNEDSFSAQLSGNYTAESDYGTFTEEGNIYINGNPYTIGQVYKYQAQIVAQAAGMAGDVAEVVTYKTDMEGFIKTGVLERETSKPVFGMEIGYNKNTYTVDGKEYTNSNPAKIRITPLRIGFYQGDYEVAYLENKAIYFPAAHITGGSIEIGDNFSVDNQGNMKALNAEIEGTVKAGSGFIGGFQIRGSSQSEGNYWPCSFSSILTPSDGKPSDDYQYAVFIRGNYTENGEVYGAVDTAHNVFGIKKRAKTVTNWDNDKAPYVYRVTVKGEVHCTSITPGKIYGDYLTANENRVRLGREPDNTNNVSIYAKPIEFYTSDEIKIGTYANKASNIYILASGTVRIGQYSANTALGKTQHPPTANVQIEASTLVKIGASGYAVGNFEVYSNSLTIYCGTSKFAGHIAPNATTSYSLGTSDYKWEHIYSKYLTVNSAGINMGGESFSSAINITTTSDVTIKGNKVIFTDTNSGYTYSFGTVVKQLLKFVNRVEILDNDIKFKNIQTGDSTSTISLSDLYTMAALAYGSLL